MMSSISNNNNNPNTVTNDQDRFRFPEGVVRVTAGMGGEALLIFGPEKTALYDTGMAYCQAETIKNIEGALEKEGRTQLDYLLVSHSHYDHAGAMPYILKRWPGITVIGSLKAQKVFRSEGARATMKRLGEAARDNFSDLDLEIETDGMRVDIAAGDGDHIDMGQDSYIEVLETKGHTDCCLTYVLQPADLMFTSESTGLLSSPDSISCAVLKSYQDSCDSAEKCRAYHAKSLISPHYGMVPDQIRDSYFDRFLETLKEEKDLVLQYFDQGMNKQEIYAKMEEHFWFDGREKNQTREAFEENMNIEISLFVSTFRGAEL